MVTRENELSKWYSCRSVDTATMKICIVVEHDMKDTNKLQRNADR